MSEFDENEGRGPTDSAEPVTTTRATPSLSRSTAIMTVGTLLSRVTGVGRTVALVYALGDSAFSASYNLANQAPTSIYELVIGGILAATLVPVFVRQFTDHEKDERRAWNAVSAVLTTVTVAAVTLSALIVLLAPVIAHLMTFANKTGDVAEQREVVTFLLRLFAPQVAIYGFISVTTAILNSRRLFGPPMFAPIFNNLVLICLFLATASFVDKGELTLDAILANETALWLVGIGTTAGVASMALLLIPFLRKAARGNLRWNWEPRHPAVKTVIRLSGWTLGFVAANQAAFQISSVLVNTVPAEVIPFLTAYTFFILPHGIYAVSVMSALQPELAGYWAKDRRDVFRDRVVVGLRLISFVIVPAAVGYALLAQPIVQMVVEHGAFSSTGADKMAWVLFWMVVGLPGFSLFIYFARVLQSMQDAKTVFYLYVVENAINIVAVVALYPAIGLYAAGIGQSLGYTVGAFIAFFVLRRRTGGLPARSVADGLIRISIAAAIMGVVVYFVYAITPGAAIWGSIAAILAGAVTYFGLTLVLRLPELRMLLRRGRAPSQ